jgi:hypothetical protein
MSLHTNVAEKLKLLADLLNQKPFASVPSTAWEKAAKDLDKVIRSLKPYYTEPKAPGPADVKLAKAHETTGEIKSFINRDKETKAFFSTAYFQNKCASLPDKNLARAVQKSQTRDGYLTAFLVYHYWQARPEPLKGLIRAYHDIRADFDNSPAVKKAEQARALLRDLLKEPDLQRIATELQSNYPNKDDLGAFAKAVGIKVAAGKKPLNERIAAKILKSGEIVRTSFRGSSGKTS